MKPLIGIDLGTTNSLVAVFEDGLPRLLPNALGESMTPSAVGILESGELVVGRAALDLRLSRPECVASGFKRHMGTGRVVRIAGREFSAPELSSLVLAALKRDAEAALGVAVEEAVITVPAYFNQLQREDTRRAALLAGLEVSRIVNEPTAAALSYGQVDRGADRTLLVFDLGGGTFDVTVMEVFDGTLEIVATAGESMLGGEDFTAAICANTLRSVGRNLEQAEVESPLLVARLVKLAEQAKRELCSEGRASLRIPGENGEAAGDARELAFDAADFERWTERLQERLTRPLHRALGDAKRSWAEVDEVLLVGGATRMPLVKDLIARIAGKRPAESVNPDYAVALGAAVQAALIANDSSVGDLVMTDVCPFTLGVSVCKEIGSQMSEGYFLPVIHRNTTIPTSRERIVGTIFDGQTEMEVDVYQGEARKVEDNTQLGRFRVTGIPKGPRGQQVALRFTYDLNGLLEVDARVEATGAMRSILIRDHAREVRDKDLEKARKRLQELKFYPRDDFGNRALLLFAEGCMKEVALGERDDLEHALDVYEAALAEATRDQFGVAREQLVETLERCGFRYDERGDA